MAYGPGIGRFQIDKEIKNCWAEGHKLADEGIKIGSKKLGRPWPKQSVANHRQ